MKKVLKFKFDEKEGFLSVVERDNNLYALVQKDTPKIKEIKETNKLLISYELKQPIYEETQVKVLDDQTLTAWVYHQLEEEKNLYFKELNDTLCVLEIPIKSL
ncbi:MAG: hypothetical protein WC189_04750, partial [Bacilli bacterium]